MINVALIGTGYWGGFLKEYIEKNPHLSLKVICDSKSNLNNEVYNNHEIDAVIVATPNKTHYSIVKDLLINNKHVLCEKPLAFKKTECKELKKLALKHNVLLCVDYTYTFSYGLYTAKKLIEAGHIGDMKIIEIRMKQLGRFGVGDVYWLLASHMLAALNMFIPLKELKFSKKDFLSNNGFVESGIINFRNKNIIGEIFVSLNYPEKERLIVIYGEKGVIIYNPSIIDSLQLITYEKEFNHLITHSIKKIAYKINEKNNLEFAIEFFSNVNRYPRVNPWHYLYKQNKLAESKKIQLRLT